MSEDKILNLSIQDIDPNHDLTDRERGLIERMAQAVKVCVDENQFLDDWLIGKAVFNEFKGELEMLDTLIDEKDQCTKSN